MNKYLDRFLTISTADPDDTRRRRTLNILLLGVGVISILALMITLLYLVLSKSQIENDTLLLIIGSIVTLAGVIIIYFINLLWSGRIAAIIFLMLLTTIFSFSDSPAEVSSGRSLFAFTIPIIMASILLVPWYSFQAILNSIADGVVVFDREWNAILANPAMKNMLDLPIELIVNKNFRNLIEHPRLSIKSRSLLYAMMGHDTQPPSFRIEWDKKTLSISAAQVYDNSEERNRNIGTVTVFRDFTREAEVEKLKSTFVAMVSHELRTPLNAILGYAEMFKEAVYGPMNDKQINMADRIMKNTQRLLGLINDLLDQAQMEAGKLTVQMSPLQPAELLENLHSLMDKIVHDKGLRLTSEIDDNLPEVLNGDAARLQQILVNLVNNAVKFTDQGTVHVRLFCPYENKWGIEVSDTGLGIPEVEISSIFETFRQVERAANRVHGGFGLGLSIVQQLVHLMNGDIQVESKVGQGSTFIITLPLVVPEEGVENWSSL